jgi:hypothetical protein
MLREELARLTQIRASFQEVYGCELALIEETGAVLDELESREVQKIID